MSRHIFAEYLLSRARTESVNVQNWGGSRRSAFHRPASNSGQSANGPFPASLKCAPAPVDQAKMQRTQKLPFHGIIVKWIVRRDFKMNNEDFA
ncbi:hypothetical protein [Parasphingorhabdus sp.]|uniref:hypothetical protein n=1 Tax=Parasphingorhabdus sp. TaxID=2709688 RepID=UPI0032F04D0C